MNKIGHAVLDIPAEHHGKLDMCVLVSYPNRIRSFEPLKSSLRVNKYVRVFCCHVVDGNGLGF